MQAKRISITRDENGTELLHFLSSRLKLSRNKAKQLLDARRVFVNRRRVWMARHILRAGDEVEIRVAQPSSPTITVLHQDAQLVMVNKPPGVLSTGHGSVEEQMQHAPGHGQWVAVHRLDRETSGCLLLATSAKAKARMIPLFKAKKISKCYRAVVLGRFPDKRAELDDQVDGQRAVTRIRLLAANRLASFIEATPITGRTHQIRKHLALAGYPVLGDNAYQAGPIESDLVRSLPRHLLHAYSLAFDHPFTKQPLRVRAPLPPDFREVLKQVKLSG